MTNEQNFFSIYKIDLNKFRNIQGFNKKEKYIENIQNFVITEIKHKLEKRDAEYADIDTEGVKGIVYKTIHHPEWEELIHKLAIQSIGRVGKKPLFEMENVNVSYILFYCSKENMYSMTAGYGNHLIKEYIEKNWGLYLIPKLLNDEAGVIREVKENNIYGNTMSTWSYVKI